MGVSGLVLLEIVVCTCRFPNNVFFNNVLGDLWNLAVLTHNRERNLIDYSLNPFPCKHLLFPASYTQTNTTLSQGYFIWNLRLNIVYKNLSLYTWNIRNSIVLKITALSKSQINQVLFSKKILCLGSLGCSSRIWTELGGV